MGWSSALPALLAISLTAGCGKAESGIVLKLGTHAIQAETATTPEARMRGLMFRRSLPDNGGMLFVFPTPMRQCMWMQDTAIPLSVAFLDDQGRILNIEEMAARTRTLHCSAGPARYALEMNAGWFGRHGGRAGMTLSGLARAPKPE